ncbi:MAG: glutamate synthase large subunit [Candidatus Dormibacteria bacterium]
MQRTQNERILKTQPRAPAAEGLYDPRYEHDGCGVGFVASRGRAPSRQVVELALSALRRLVHRGAFGADPRSGDGAGILLQLPDRFLRREAATLGMRLPPPARYAVTSLFLPRHDGDRRLCERLVESCVGGAGLRVLGWRAVPCRPLAAGERARAVRPHLRQCFIGGASGVALERRLYPLRKRIEARGRELAFRDPCSQANFVVVSCSGRTLVYKGQLSATQLDRFYPDLRSPDLESCLAIFHQRFSTNTEPSWRLAQPFHGLGHNGEINTLRGNINWMRARERAWTTSVCGSDPADVLPVVEPGGSDSMGLDNAFELLLRTGRSLAEAVMMLMPPAWEADPECSPAEAAFYRYQARLLEPWDGPAAIAFTDGRAVGAALDRNGLRPARYLVTDELVVLASEVGVVTLPEHRIRQQGRLGPADILLVDTATGELTSTPELRRRVVRRHPYRRALARARVPLLAADPPAAPVALEHWHAAFGYSEEELERSLLVAAGSGHEAVASMGDDAPLAVLSSAPRLLFDYFSQGFAQVTNPPIDPIRERCVMSLRTSLGGGGDLLTAVPQVIPRVELEHPVLTCAALARLRSQTQLQSRTLRALFPAASGPSGLEPALDELCAGAESAVAAGVRLLILSDRETSSEFAPIPSLLAVGAVHHHLVRHGTRGRISLLVESAEPRSVHHLACLVGHGAEGVNPYLALWTVAASGRRELDSARLIDALAEGLRKVMSKLGISTFGGYCGAQAFETVGLCSSLVDRCFTGTPARLQGADMRVLAAEVLIRHARAFARSSAEAAGELGGHHRWRHGDERHGWNPVTVAALQQSVRLGDPERFNQFVAGADAPVEAATALRHLLEPVSRGSVPLPEVEPATAIVRRFVTGAMSLGALGQEAHETLALAMNQLGAKSNTGEGGEDGERFLPDAAGRSRRSAIKQVASARFGVSAHYLVNADELQIKIAQGAKPGEGGQLPGHKVDATIARLRHSPPGVELISPPPHHDIYSIEDLAQLIWDLRQANPRARLSVKLVAQAGVGTVAAGVVKAGATHLTISGHEGGTGAAPLSSIKHVGVPWELGLAETQQTLVRHGLRSQVTLQTDGGLRTGRDVMVAALLGAEEFGFATAALVASGCVLMRVCHLNTCPVGIATQDPVLRRRFAGQPEHVVRFFMLLAEDVRRHLAQLGFRSLGELVGRVEHLQSRSGPRPWKARGLDLAPLLHRPARADAAELRGQRPAAPSALDSRLGARLGLALDGRERRRVRSRVGNHDRAVGAWLSGEIARRHGASGLPEGTVRLRLVGVAGQSLGAWLVRGVSLTCVGSANDYPGKGLSHGRLVLRPPPGAAYRGDGHVIAGNVALYGATGGEAYFAGAAGERFAVRNSGAVAVVEGVGDHGCEYMTGGVVVVMGRVGRNFAAGMTGGRAYVFDASGELPRRLNRATVELGRPAPDEERELVRLLRRHRRLTGSERAQRLLSGWASNRREVLVVRPRGAAGDGAREAAPGA